MTLSQLALLALASFAGLSQAATNDDWASRSIYQIITDRFARPDNSDAECNINNYCGGTWAGIETQLDYIQNMGFTAIQISPLQKNLNNNTIYGEAFHGYWVQDLYSLNENFGTADDLRHLVSELHRRDMYLLVDVVAYEVAWDIGDANMTAETYVNYADFHPFNSPDYFHPYCPIIDWSNQTEYQNCWLGYTGVATPDLKTENATVVRMLGTWIHELISNYSIDGIRIDGAKQIDYGFFQPFVESAGVYAMAEVDDGNANTTCSYQNSTGGLENYPLSYSIIRAFTAGQMSNLVSMIGDMRENCPQPQYLATFIENQDNERFASYVDDTALAANAIAFTILADGIPKMYYGQEQHLTGNYSPYNRQALWPTNYDTTSPLYTMTATLNKLRNHAISVNDNYIVNSSSILYTDESTYAARKGPNGSQIVTVLSNQGRGMKRYQLAVPGAAFEGINMTEVLSCTTVVAGNNGTINFWMGAGEPKVFFPTFSLDGSGLCGHRATGTSGGASPSGASGTATGSSASSTGTQRSFAPEAVKVQVWMALALVGGSVALLI